MTTLHLGVIEQVYQLPRKKKVGRARKGKNARPKKSGAARTITTGDVAEILEAKYHIMEIFYELNKKFVGDSLTKSLQGSLESVLMGGPPSADPFKAACSSIETRMKDFISKGEMEKIGYPGVPTQAALKGINHRLAHPYAKANKRRPSFIDYGLYQQSMKAWTT